MVVHKELIEQQYNKDMWTCKTTYENSKTNYEYIHNRKAIVIQIQYSPLQQFVTYKVMYNATDYGGGHQQTPSIEEFTSSLVYQGGFLQKLGNAMSQNNSERK